MCGWQYRCGPETERGDIRPLLLFKRAIAYRQIFVRCIVLRKVYKCINRSCKFKIQRYRFEKYCHTQDLNYEIRGSQTYCYFNLLKDSFILSYSTLTQVIQYLLYPLLESLFHLKNRKELFIQILNGVSLVPGTLLNFLLILQ